MLALGEGLRRSGSVYFSNKSSWSRASLRALRLLKKVTTKMAAIARPTRATITKIAATAPFLCQKLEVVVAADTGVTEGSAGLEDAGSEYDGVNVGTGLFVIANVVAGILSTDSVECTLVCEAVSCF